MFEALRFQFYPRLRFLLFIYSFYFLSYCKVTLGSFYLLLSWLWLFNVFLKVIPSVDYMGEVIFLRMLEFYLVATQILFEHFIKTFC